MNSFVVGLSEMIIPRRAASARLNVRQHQLIGTRLTDQDLVQDHLPGPGTTSGPTLGPGFLPESFKCIRNVHMARYGIKVRQDKVTWLRIISKPLLTQKGAIKDPQIQKKITVCATSAKIKKTFYRIDEGSEQLFWVGPSASLWVASLDFTHDTDTLNAKDF